VARRVGREFACRIGVRQRGLIARGAARIDDEDGHTGKDVDVAPSGPDEADNRKAGWPFRRGGPELPGRQGFDLAGPGGRAAAAG
jgi:hypothetical protein